MNGTEEGLAYVRVNPGCTTYDVAKAMGWMPGSAVDVLAVLERGGRIVTRYEEDANGRSGQWTYHPAQEETE
jgi:hypothetical protein